MDVVRCWETSDPAYNSYHDDEWGRPVRDERGLYERLCLEGFQSGLSWLTILRKREAFRAGFAEFDPELVACFGERDVKRLLADAGIVRHRGKIEAAIATARATVELRDTTPLDELLWSYAPERSGLPGDQGAAVLAKDLRRRGFRFVGPTTVLSALQACGVVNDHRADCWVRQAVEAERTKALAT
ncbi:MAG: DNA-3-methyladenine glycosylase I [Gaiellaceae bacterium]